MPPKSNDAGKAAAEQAKADKAAAEKAAADQVEADKAAAEKAAADQVEADKAAAEKAAADQAAAEALTAAGERVIGTVDAPTKAHTAKMLAKLGIEVLAEAKVGEKLVCRVLQDAKRVWKEVFHEA